MKRYPSRQRNPAMDAASGNSQPACEVVGNEPVVTALRCLVLVGKSLIGFPVHPLRTVGEIIDMSISTETATNAGLLRKHALHRINPLAGIGQAKALPAPGA